MDDQKKCQNWEGMYCEVQEKVKCLEKENATLSDKLKITNDCVMNLEDNNKTLHDEMLELTGKVKAFEFVLSRVKDINI